MGNHQLGSARKRGYTWKWEKARALFLKQHPLCVMCSAEGRVTAATVVDHIIPHRQDAALVLGSQQLAGPVQAAS